MRPLPASPPPASSVPAWPPGSQGPQLAAALTVSGFLAASVERPGTGGGVRQTYPRRSTHHRPGGGEPSEDGQPRRRRRGRCTHLSEGTAMVTAQALSSSDGTVMSDLSARPGDRVLLDVRNAPTGHRSAAPAGRPRRPRPEGSVSAAWTCGRRAHGILRRLVGYGARGMMLARDEHRARRLLPQRRDVGRRGGDRLLALVGLAERVGRLPPGCGHAAHPRRRTADHSRARPAHPRPCPLRHAGPLLVFDHLDADLGRDGRATMRDCFGTTPGWWCSPATTRGRW